MEDKLKVGIITSTHGVRGEVKVYPTTDDVNRFKKLKSVMLDTGKEMITLEITGVKFFKNMVILKFKGIDNVDDVQKYRQKDLYVTRKDAVKLQKDEYFIADLIGIEVFDEEGIKVGILKEVIPTGANDVYVIELIDDYAKKGQKEVLIPAIKQCILDVKPKDNCMIVHLMEGLLE